MSADGILQVYDIWDTRQEFRQDIEHECSIVARIDDKVTVKNRTLGLGK